MILSTSIFFFFLIFPTRARGVGRCWSHFWVQLTLNYSMMIPTRARADSRNPFCMFFGNTKNDFFQNCPRQISICIVFLYMEHSEMNNRVHAKQSSHWETTTKFYLYKQSVHKKFLFVLYFLIWSILKWPTESMQSKAHIEKPQQNSICISRVSTRNFYLYCIS